MARHPTLTIGRLADAAGVHVETIRYYQRQGLLDEPTRAPGAIRRYRDADVARVRFIKAAQRLGFALDEVAQLLSLDDGRQCAQARASAEAKLADVRSRLADLRRIEAALDALVDRCADGRGRQRCPLIRALHEAA